MHSKHSQFSTFEFLKALDEESKTKTNKIELMKKELEETNQSCQILMDEITKNGI
jgi:hypothetical protein